MNGPVMFSPPAGNPTQPRKSSSKVQASGVEDRVLVLEVEQVHQIERLDNMETDIKTLKDAIFDSKDEPGMLSRLGRLEEYMSDIKKLAWAILIVLLGIVVAQFYNILIIHPMP